MNVTKLSQKAKQWYCLLGAPALFLHELAHRIVHCIFRHRITYTNMWDYKEYLKLNTIVIKYVNCSYFSSALSSIAPIFMFLFLYFMLIYTRWCDLLLIYLIVWYEIFWPSKADWNNVNIYFEERKKE